MPLREPAEDPTALKACPECAEEVKSAANVCRYCGHRFDGTAAPAGEASQVPDTRKSELGAFLLSLVIAGLGQLYVGETKRGAVWLTAVAVGVFGAYGTGTIGPGIIISIAASLDAVRVTRAYNGTGARAGVTGGMWAMLAAVILLVGIALANAEDNTEPVIDGQTNSEFRDANYERCVADAALTEQDCAEIYLTP